jgi:hypothetical protein
VELPNHEGELLMFCPGWTNDPASLMLPLRETGWFATTGEAMEAAANTRLSWIWMGVNDDLELVECTWNGVQLGEGGNVTDVMQVTLAQVPSHR